MNQFNRKVVPSAAATSCSSLPNLSSRVTLMAGPGAGVERPSSSLGGSRQCRQIAALPIAWLLAWR
jgi:hypothetical protein